MEKKLPQIRSRLGIDLTVTNGENASEIRGLSHEDADRMLRTCADIITEGNYIFGKKVFTICLIQVKESYAPQNIREDCRARAIQWLM